LNTSRPPTFSARSSKEKQNLNQTTERSVLSGFGNQTRITEENEQEGLVFDETEERSFEQSRTEKSHEPQSSSKKDNTSKGTTLKNNYVTQSVSEGVEHSGNEKFNN